MGVVTKFGSSYSDDDAGDADQEYMYVVYFMELHYIIIPVYPIGTEISMGNLERKCVFTA